MINHFNPLCKIVAMLQGRQIVAIHCEYNDRDIENAKFTVKDLMAERYGSINNYELYLVIRNEA